MAGVPPVSAAKVHILSGKDEMFPMDLREDHVDAAPLPSQTSSLIEVAPTVNLVSQRNLHNISTDLRGFYDGINRLYYLEKAMQALHPTKAGVEPDIAKTDEYLARLDLPQIPELIAQIKAGDLKKAKDLLNTINLLKQAADELKKPNPNFDKADRAVRKLGAYLVDDLKEALRLEDYSLSLKLLARGRRDVATLVEVFELEIDAAEALVVDQLEVPMFSELRAAIMEKNLNYAIAALENWRSDSSPLKEAIAAMPDIEQVQKILADLGVYLVGGLRVAILARDLEKAKTAFDKSRNDISCLKEVMSAIHPTKGRPDPAIRKAKSLIGKLGVYLLGQLKTALEAGDLQIAVEALERSRKEIALVQDAINAMNPVDGAPNPHLADASLAKMGFKLVGELKKAIEERNLYKALEEIELWKEDIRNKSYFKGEKVGGGSYGDVHRVVHSSTMRPGVMKTQKLTKRNGEPARAARREAETLGAIQRNAVPHSVLPIEIFRSSPGKKPHLNIVMPELQALKHGKVIPLDQLRSMAYQAGGYFIGMKDIKRLHNDIKPSNLGWDGYYLSFFDYGLSCASYDPMLTDPATNIGTNQYQAPEFLFGYPLNDNPTMDLWSWGVTLIELYLGEHLFPRNGDSIEEIRQHALGIIDQIGTPSMGYLKKCNQERLKEIFHLDADGDIEGVRRPLHPRWSTTPWDERMRAKAGSQGDDLLKLEGLIDHIRGLLNYADVRELSGFDFPNITFRLKGDLKHNQFIVFYPENSDPSAPPILVVKGGVSYSCLHLPIPAHAKFGDFLWGICENGKLISPIAPCRIENEGFLTINQKATPITPLRSQIFSETAQLPLLPSAARGVGSSSGPSQAALPQAAPSGKRKRQEDGDQPDAAKRLDLHNSPEMAMDRDEEREKDRDIPRRPLPQAQAPMEQGLDDLSYPDAASVSSIQMPPPKAKLSSMQRKEKMKQINAVLGNPLKPKAMEFDKDKDRDIPRRPFAEMNSQYRGLVSRVSQAQAPKDLGYPFAAPARVLAAPEKPQKTAQVASILRNPPIPNAKVLMPSQVRELLPPPLPYQPLGLRLFSASSAQAIPMPLPVRAKSPEPLSLPVIPDSHMDLGILANVAAEADHLPLPVRAKSPEPLPMPIRPGSPDPGQGFTQGPLLGNITG